MDPPCRRVIQLIKEWSEIMIISSDGIEISYALRFEFKAYNNEAEYKALIVELKMARSLWA